MRHLDSQLLQLHFSRSHFLGLDAGGTSPSASHIRSRQLDAMFIESTPNGLPLALVEPEIASGSSPVFHSSNQPF